MLVIMLFCFCADKDVVFEHDALPNGDGSKTHYIASGTHVDLLYTYEIPDVEGYDPQRLPPTKNNIPPREQKSNFNPYSIFMRILSNLFGISS